MSKQMGRTGLMVLPPDPGRKSSNLILIKHRGGGWYSAVCFGGSKKCRAGECRHVTGLAFKTPNSTRRIKPIALVNGSEPENG